MRKGLKTRYNLHVIALGTYFLQRGPASSNFYNLPTQ
jgi:hypothetical protein